MAQLEQYEQRALEAEHTLEDVKMELLKVCCRHSCCCYCYGNKIVIDK